MSLNRDPHVDEEELQAISLFKNNFHGKSIHPPTLIGLTPSPSVFAKLLKLFNGREEELTLRMRETEFKSVSMEMIGITHYLQEYHYTQDHIYNYAGLLIILTKFSQLEGDGELREKIRIQLENTKKHIINRLLIKIKSLKGAFIKILHCHPQNFCFEVFDTMPLALFIEKVKENDFKYSTTSHETASRIALHKTFATDEVYQKLCADEPLTLSRLKVEEFVEYLLKNRKASFLIHLLEHPLNLFQTLMEVSPNGHLLYRMYRDEQMQPHIITFVAKQTQIVPREVNGAYFNVVSSDIDRDYFVDPIGRWGNLNINIERTVYWKLKGFSELLTFEGRRQQIQKLHNVLNMAVFTTTVNSSSELPLLGMYLDSLSVSEHLSGPITRQFAMSLLYFLSKYGAKESKKPFSKPDIILAANDAEPFINHMEYLYLSQSIRHKIPFSENPAVVFQCRRIEYSLELTYDNLDVSKMSPHKLYVTKKGNELVCCALEKKNIRTISLASLPSSIAKSITETAGNFLDLNAEQTNAIFNITSEEGYFPISLRFFSENSRVAARRLLFCLLAHNPDHARFGGRMVNINTVSIHTPAHVDKTFSENIIHALAHIEAISPTQRDHFMRIISPEQNRVDDLKSHGSKLRFWGRFDAEDCLSRNHTGIPHYKFTP